MEMLAIHGVMCYRASAHFTLQKQGKEDTVHARPNV